MIRIFYFNGLLMIQKKYCQNIHMYVSTLLFSSFLYTCYIVYGLWFKSVDSFLSKFRFYFSFVFVVYFCRGSTNPDKNRSHYHHKEIRMNIHLFKFISWYLMFLIIWTYLFQKISYIFFNSSVFWCTCYRVLLQWISPISCLVILNWVCSFRSVFYAILTWR